MGVLNNGLSALPDSVAFKRMIRNLMRAQDYVPPYQPSTVAPLAEAEAAASAAAASGALIEARDWTLGQNDRGDLVARHVSGAEVVIAPNPEGNDRG